MSKEKSGFIELPVPTVKRKYTQQEKKQHCETWKQSGKSKRAYCKEHGITHSNFSEWLKQMTAPINFFNEKKVINEVEVLTVPIELILPSGVRLRFSKTHVSEIIQLIKGIEACS